MTAPALADAYDLVIFDLDGVVYLMDQPIPGAVEAIAELHTRGLAVAYATNNASRRAPDVADLLTRIGVPAEPGEVFTSAQAAAAALAERHPPDSAVLVVGADALRAEVRDAGLTVVDTADAGPHAVVQGYGPDVGWPQLAEACVAVRAGADWVVTNTDTTLPSARGPLPGNGALVAAVRTAVGRAPDLVVGKPAPGLFSAVVKHAGATRPLVVGDRLDTDIEGAVRAGIDSLLVLTGITDAKQLLTAPERQRPTHIAADLSGLFTMDTTGGWAVSGGELTGAGSTIDALRALCAAVWVDDPAAGVPAGGPAGVKPGSAAAADAMRELGLG